MYRASCLVLPLLLLVGCGRADDPAAIANHAGHAAAQPDGRLAGDPLLDAREADPVRDSVAGDPRALRLHPLRPMTTDSEVLFGDPTVEGQPFVIRIRELPGVIVPPHTHPVDEHVTVVQGTWYFGIGDEFDPSKLQVLPAGSYAFVPAGTPMFAYSPEPAIVQVHGLGPFDIHWKHGIATIEDPGSAATFRYRVGERVSTPRGAGRIVWAGASGPLIQYQIEGADGNHFVVQEREIRSAR